MTELLTAAQMRTIEQAAIASGEVTGLELMERAGRGVVEAILEEWPDMALTSQKVVVLCGPGNNGGDGFVVARLLKQRGWEVEVFLYGEVGKLPPDARVNAERWLEMGVVGLMSAEIVHQFGPFDLRVDAVFGAGLRCKPNKIVEKYFTETWGDGSAHSKKHIAKRVAVDCPSCVDLDSGRILRDMQHWEGDFERDFYASLTVTFHRKKLGHIFRKAQQYSGRVIVVDIGLGKLSSDDVLVKMSQLEKREHSETQYAWPAAILTKFSHDSYDNHKFSHGHALILSGPAGRTGAARLAARGALRIGAGVVSLACPQAAMAENAVQLTAIMLSPVENAEALHAVLQDKRINALCLGPALGHDARAKGLIATALESGCPLVLDADALSESLIGHLHKNVVLTPHAGEFTRMFPDIMAKLEAPALTGPAYSKVDATREAAARAGCTVLFKGADTVIADQTGRAAINSAHYYERAAPWLATAGSGDVLAGFITGLMARGFAPMQAAETAAWLHVECALKFGPGLIAEDIPEQLPAVFRDLQL